MEEDELDELIMRCPRDMDALEKLYIAFKGDVTALAHSILRNRENTEDAVQETFTRLRSAARGYKPRKKGKVYILKIAANTAHEIYRKSKRPIGSEIPLSPGPIDEFARVEAAIVVEQLLAYLDNKERELIVLRYYSDLTLSQTAAVLGKPVSSVQWRLEALFAKIRSYGIEIELDEP